METLNIILVSEVFFLSFVRKYGMKMKPESKEEENKEKILKAADELFRKYGLRSVTMNDIAKALGISKKTIYQYFRDKNEIACLVAENMCQEDAQWVEMMEDKADNAIEAVMKMTEYMKEMQNKINPTLVYDAEKYYPDVSVIYHRFHGDFLYKAICKNLTRGIQDGLYRKDLNIDLVATMRIASFEIMVNEKFFPRDKYNLLEIGSEITEYFVRGLLTLKGFQLLEHYKNK